MIAHHVLYILILYIKYYVFLINEFLYEPVHGPARTTQGTKICGQV